ncbi:[protein-PII] uridylyltransferase [Acidiferrobacter sp.]|uniref:[protein-PII] uridylyltransferase n=1 Tax=Acidiferrobacter sp. TaxID=1872107 RepID=UPI0026331A38|nr:[protein-PII] uridylyltransferase [Acidiferrobacter sp.]
MATKAVAPILDPDITRFRDMLRAGDARLRAAHDAELPRRRRGLGIEALHLRTALIDDILRKAYVKHEPLLPNTVSMALVAVGGYGRSELHPASDIDLLLLQDSPQYAKTRSFAEPFLRFLWDIGLTVGHSVRSRHDCLQVARSDVTVMTNLMEARLLIGDEALLARLVHDLASPTLWQSARFFEAKLAEQRARHTRYDDTGYNLEPNVKEGPGGLRDIHMIGWIAQRHFGSANLHDLVKVGFLDEREYRTLIDARNFLWQIRNGLHLLARRREDRLLFDHQRTLALQMGYVDRPGQLAVEQFMKRYYRTIKQVQLLNEILLQHFAEALRGPRRPVITPLSPWFRARNGFLEVVDAHVFTENPRAILDLFRVLQEHPELQGMRAATIRLLRAHLSLIDGAFRQDPATRSAFLAILRAPTGVTKALRRMNAYGVLGAYIPAFGKIVGQMQHDLFHVYTVDEHSLFVLRNVRRIMQPEFEAELPAVSEIGRALAKPERLYLAALFHDIAKGRGGDHSRLGESEARAFCHRLGLSEYDREFVAWLVRHHLVMSWTAQHTDISDPQVVADFARLVGDREHLDNLYVLTVADIRGTSPSVWNDWKGQLLTGLYRDATRILRRGIGEAIALDARVADARREALERIGDRAPREAIEQHWARMDADYFLRHDAEALAWHACAIAGHRSAALPIIEARVRPDHAAVEFLIFSPLSDELFAVLTGSLERLNLSIVDARVHMASGYALDCFVALTADGKPPCARELSQMSQQVHADLAAGFRETPVRPLPRALKNFPITTEVRFSSTANGQLTVMEVIAQDRPGLLHQLALALLAGRTRIVTAKVATFGERAEDIFFLTDERGKPFGQGDSQRLADLATAIRARIDGPTRLSADAR